MFLTGTVVATYPEGNSVDVLIDQDGARLSNVQVLSGSASSNSGMIDLPSVGGPTGDLRWDPTAQRDRLVTAMVGFCRGVPFVAGFLLPQVNHITFQQPNRRIDRHASDVYSTIDDSGNMEVAHPSGTYLRIGTSPAHEDLTAQDYDKKWAIARNTGAAVHVQLTVKNGGSQVASLNIDPSGDVTLTHSGSLTVNTGGTAQVTAGGAATVKAPTVTIDSPQTTCTGMLTVEGLFTYQAGMAGSGGAGGASANITGNIHVIGGDVTADSISLKNHTHSDPQGGSVGPAVG